MDLKFTAEDEAFRKEVRGWLEANLPAELRHRGVGGYREDEDEEIQRDWQKRLHRGGWLKLAWPVEHGGRDASPVQQAIYQEELAAVGAPPILGRLGVSLAAPTINVLGSQWQKDTYIEKLLACEEVWAQGFSEPNAGSDLASLTTKAVRDGDKWILNGQKVWSSGAHYSDRSFLLARTDPEAPPHKGIGYFIVDLDLVGAPGDGWKAAMTTFGFERGGLANASRFESAVNSLAALARNLGQGSDPRVRQRVAQAKIEAHTFRMNGLRALTKAQQGAAPGPEASLTKLYWSEMDKRLQETAVAIQGPYGALSPDDAWSLEEGRWQFGWMWSQAETIYAGSSEIQRNIIAERVLGLPRGR